MPFNKEAYLRYKIIDACISSNNNSYPTMDDIRQSCEDKLGKKFSVPTIQKDINAMKTDELLGFNAPVRFSRHHKGYYYADKNYSINSIPLNDFRKTRKCCLFKMA